MVQVPNSAMLSSVVARNYKRHVRLLHKYCKYIISTFLCFKVSQTLEIFLPVLYKDNAGSYRNGDPASYVYRKSRRALILLILWNSPLVSFGIYGSGCCKVCGVAKHRQAEDHRWSQPQFFLNTNLWWGREMQRNHIIRWSLFTSRIAAATAIVEHLLRPLSSTLLQWHTSGNRISSRLDK
jgi:hypothetical protein